MKRLAAFAVLCVLTACGQPQQEAPPATEELSVESAAPRPSLPPVDAELLAAPNDAFAAIEPSEVDVFAAPTVLESLELLLGPEQIEGEEAQFTLRGQLDTATADIVRTGLADDSVEGAHLRFEFRREPDGWFPTNAYRRMKCRRGAQAGQWSAALCP